MLKNKIWDNFQRIVEVFTQKIFNMLSNIWVRDPGSGKNLFRIQQCCGTGTGTETVGTVTF
jgi:hypothetical protein